QQHPIHESLKDLLGGTKTIELDRQDPESRDGYSRFVRCLRFVDRNLKGVDPALVTNSALNQLNKSCDQVKQHHEKFSKKETDWKTLNDQVDSLLDQLHRLPRLAGPVGATDFSAEVENLRHSGNEFTESMQGELNKLETTAEKFRKRINNLEGKL